MRQAHAAGIFWCVEAPEAEIFGDIVQALAFIFRQVGALSASLALQYGTFQRQQFIPHKTLDEVSQHSVIFIQLKVHLRSSGCLIMAVWRVRTPQGKESGKAGNLMTLGKGRRAQKVPEVWQSQTF